MWNISVANNIVLVVKLLTTKKEAAEELHVSANKDDNQFLGDWIVKRHLQPSRKFILGTCTFQCQRYSFHSQHWFH